jgi:hypothetical protein
MSAHYIPERGLVEGKDFGQIHPGGHFWSPDRLQCSWCGIDTVAALETGEWECPQAPEVPE